MDAIRPLLSASQVATIERIKQRGYETVQAFWHDAYALWTVNRSAGWADGAGVEAQALIEEGVGKLYANGGGGPQGGEVIHLESPYRFRTHASATIGAGHLLVVNGTRLFRVDVAKREAADDPLMDVYLTELVATPMPGPEGP